MAGRIGDYEWRRKMTIDEAIQHCEEVAIKKEEEAIIYHNCAKYKQNLYEKGLAKNTEKECRACAEEHRQLAEWLRELKAYRNKSEIPTSCSDAVSREAVIEWLADRTEIYDEMGNFVSADKVRKKCEDMISELPSVNLQQNSHSVIYSGDGYYDGQPVYDMANCPHCDYDYEEDDKDWGMPYCPNCGTRLNWETEG